MKTQVSRYVNVLPALTVYQYVTDCHVADVTSQEDLLLACDEVKSAGENMHQAAIEFSHDTLDSERRETMVAAARVLLMAVTRLLVVVDAVDVQRMFRTSNRVQYTCLGLVGSLRSNIMVSSSLLSTLPLLPPQYRWR